MSFTIVAVYVSPSSDISFYDQFRKLFKEFEISKECIVLGDFYLNWSDKTTKKKLKEKTKLHDFTQLVEGPTRITATSRTVLDRIFTNQTD